ncbi:MAG: zinc ABC transporter substrate-binding protein [Lactobacillaceae bacterium]|jgi:zinc/manganese transport system substrate-binding protein|nr:zinc ABC transporter substrate-binding protein [Lactobacillaceae bacterium]
MLSNKVLSKWLLVIPAVIVIGLIVLVVDRGVQNNRNQTLTSSQGITVVASLDTYGEMAKAVLGKHGQVTSILNKADLDPHDFEPTASTAKAYQQANVIISNGGGYDAWSTKFAKTNKTAKDINVASLYNFKDGDNEHYWYKPSIANKLTAQLVKDYSALLPKYKAQFKQNARAYLTSLKALNVKRAEVGALLKGKTIMATEPVFNNALTGYTDVTIADQAFALAVDEGEDPTPKAVREWQTLIDQGKVAVIINNTQTSGKIVENAIQYATKHKVPIVGVTETKPDGKTYAEWQIDQLNEIEKALR